MKHLFGDFFKDKTLLITGHTGFIGSWLSLWLNELGAKVIGYALPPYTDKDNYVVTKLEEKVQTIIGDIRNYEKLKAVFNNYKPDIVYHLAAQPIVRQSYLMPKETYDVNVGGTINVFEAFRKEDTSKVLINVTTDKCYENLRTRKGYQEQDRLGGYDPYSSSKACSELITNAYRNSFFSYFTGKPCKIVSSVRSGNVVGGGDWQKDRLIPDCIRSLLNEQNIIIRNPNFIRPWQHVLEPIRGYLMLAIKMWEGDEKYSGAWNFGPEEDSIYTVQEIVEKIIKHYGKGKYKTLSSDSNKFHESEILILNITKAKNLLQWRPILSINETIELLCDWYFADKVDYEFDVNQIKKYLKKLI